MELKKILREQNDKRVKFASNIKGLSSPKLDECKRIEMLECEYLSRYYHFMMFTRSDILSGLATKEKIRTDWLPFWGNGAGTSDFAVGAERVVYALLNGKGIGIPNSAPVGSDLMFELDDAFIHIDMKTVKYDPTVTPDPKKGLLLICHIIIMLFLLDKKSKNHVFHIFCQYYIMHKMVRLIQYVLCCRVCRMEFLALFMKKHHYAQGRIRERQDSVFLWFLILRQLGTKIRCSHVQRLFI